jgi:hypothetical protein
MVVGIAATLQCLAFAINPMGGLEHGPDRGPDQADPDADVR